MIRPGHHRPLGTTTTMRFEWEHGDRFPQLDDIAYQCSAKGVQDKGDVKRCYRVVGILEGRTPDVFRLVMERVEYPTFPADPDALWTFYTTRRK